MADKLSYTSSDPLINLTHGLYGSGRQEKSYLCFPSWRVTGEMPVWCADHSTCGHSVQWSVFFQIQKTKEYCQHHPTGLQCPGPPHPHSHDWQMFPGREMVSFSFLPNDAYVLILKCKLLRMHPGDTLHIKNRSYQEWVLPEPPPPDLSPLPSPREPSVEGVEREAEPSLGSIPAVFLTLR